MSQLAIALSALHEDGVRRHFVLARMALGAGDSEAEVAQPIELDCHLLKVHREVVVSGTLETSFRLTCGRCAEEFILPLQVPFEAFFLPGQQAPFEREKALEDSGADVYTYTEHVIDLSEMVRDKLLLSVPLQPLCHPGCRGLCPSCGANWNVSTCQCAQPEPESPFQLLRELRLS